MTRLDGLKRTLFRPPLGQTVLQFLQFGHRIAMLSKGAVKERLIRIQVGLR